MRQRVIAAVLPSAFAIAMFATPVKAEPIERVEIGATGAIPLGAVVTVDNPFTATGTLRLCLTSATAGELFCTAI